MDMDLLFRMHHLFTALLFTYGMEPELKSAFLKTETATLKVRF